MNLRIIKKQKPPRLNDLNRKLFSDAERAGFMHIGWLTIFMLQPRVIAGFANSDGSIALVFIGSERKNLFDLQAVDMVSHLDGPKKLTTTTFPLVAPQFDRGIFKYAYPNATIRELFRKHQKHMRDIKAKPALFVKKLGDLKKSIREYVAFEQKTRAAAQKEHLKQQIKLELLSKQNRAKIAANDPFATIYGAATDGANYDLSTDDIIARLKQWQTLCSFRVVRAEHDTVEIEFDTLPTDMDAFVQDLYDFCPDLVDQGTGCIHEMFEMMEESGKKPTEEMQKLIEGIDFEDENYGLEILKREVQQKKKVQLWWD